MFSLLLHSPGHSWWVGGRQEVEGERDEEANGGRERENE